MPIIQKIKSELETIKKLQIEKKIMDEVKAYCGHFTVSFDEFANQAFKYVLKKDADWKKIIKSKKEKSSKEVK